MWRLSIGPQRDAESPWLCSRFPTRSVVVLPSDLRLYIQLSSNCDRRCALVKTLETEVTIRATPEQVWSVLTDFAQYPAWNPFIREASGEAKAGAHLTVRIKPPGGKEMTFRPTVLSAM